MYLTFWFFIGLQTESATNGDNDIIFKHNIRLQTPTCNCEESESFKSLLYRVNGLEEEVNYLKTQCTQGCCGGGSIGGKHKVQTRDGTSAKRNYIRMILIANSEKKKNLIFFIVHIIQKKDSFQG